MSRTDGIGLATLIVTLTGLIVTGLMEVAATRANTSALSAQTAYTSQARLFDRLETVLDPTISQTEEANAWAIVAAEFNLVLDLKDTIIEAEDWMALTSRLCIIIDQQNRNEFVPSLNEYCE